MKGISNWSIAIIGAGAIFSTGSFIRYWAIYPDLDKAFIYILMGVMIMGFGWVYHKLLTMGNIITAMEDYLADKRDVFENVQR